MDIKGKSEDDGRKEGNDSEDYGWLCGKEGCGVWWAAPIEVLERGNWVHKVWK
jgi:hypothetical protein